MEKHIFRIYDTNKDGHIDFIEFMVVFHVLSGESFSYSFSLQTAPFPSPPPRHTLLSMKKNFFIDVIVYIILFKLFFYWK